MFRLLVIAMAAGLTAPAAIEAQGLRTVSAASFQPRVAADSVASILGEDLAPRAATAVRDENGVLPFELEGVQVRIDGTPAPLLYVSPGQLNFVVPGGLETGVHHVTVQNGSFTLQGLADVRLVAPGLFSRDGSGRGPGNIVNAADNTGGPFLVETAARDQPDRRTRLRVYATGLRLAGSENNVARYVKAQAVTRAGDEIDVEIEFAGAAMGLEGIDQVDFILPEQIDGAGPVELHLAVGAAESNVVTFEVGLLPANRIRLRTVTLNSDAARGGESVTATVRLNGVARQGGLTAQLASTSPLARVPAFIQIAEGKSSATFPVLTAMVGSPQKVSITADLQGVCEKADLTLRPSGSVAVERVSLTPASVVGGTTAQGTLTLSSAAHPGYRVTLRANDARARVPATVTVPAGRISTAFSVETSPVADSAEVELTAEADDVSRTARVTLLPLVDITLDREEAIGGSSFTATARLNRSANGSAVAIRLTSDSNEVQVPATVTIPAGRTTVTFQIRTLAVNAVTAASIAANHEGMTQMVRLKLRPAVSDRIESITLSPRSVRGGERVTATITLEGPAPDPAVTVFLGTGAPWIAQVPVVFYIPAGRTSAQFTVTTSSVWQPQDVTISATSGGQTARATLRVN